MGEIRFSTGVVTYNINGCCEVAFNPTDGGFAQRLAGVFSTLDKKQAEYAAALEKAGSAEEIFAVADRLDREMREMIDGIFDKPVCEAVFGSLNVYAMADGLPVWANLLLALMGEMGDSFAREQAGTDPAVEKYLAKYKK